jgi:hypothetical protein
MSFKITVSKATSKVIFATDSAFPLQLDSLCPPSGYSTFIWPYDLDSRIFDQPWLFTFLDGGFSYDENNKKDGLYFEQANALLSIAIAINRHRRLVVRDGILGQDLVYEMKAAEAYAFLAGTTDEKDCPMLAQDAAIDGVSFQDAASLVVFRREQSLSYLRNTEVKRRQLIRKVLLCESLEEIAVVSKEIRSYERQG